MLLEMNLILVVAILAALMMFAMGAGIRHGRRRFVVAGESGKTGIAAIEGAVFALFGLLLAFTFSGAASRFDARRQLIIEETNAIGTAWLRIDLLPTDARAAMRTMFKDYLSHRIATHASLPDRAAADAEVRRVQELQDQIWRSAIAKLETESRPQIVSLVVQSLNDMFDIGAARYAATRIHVPKTIVVVLFVLAMVASYLAGFAMGRPGVLPWSHVLIFVGIIVGTIFITLDMEYPRAGLINLDVSDKCLLDLQKEMAK